MKRDIYADTGQNGVHHIITMHLLSAERKMAELTILTHVKSAGKSHTKREKIGQRGELSRSRKESFS